MMCFHWLRGLTWTEAADAIEEFADSVRGGFRESDWGHRSYY